MNSKRWKIVVGAIVMVLVIVGGGMLARWWFSQEAEVDMAKEESVEELDENYGFAAPETVVNLVAKFNQGLADRAVEGVALADDEVMLVHENNYWYPLYEDVALVVVPVEFTGDKEKDNVLAMLIYTDKDSVNREQAVLYFRNVIGVNDENLSVEEIDALISEAEGLRERGEMANWGKGIFAAVSETDDHIEYQVVRNY